MAKFERGKSGNPAGRPRGALSPANKLVKQAAPEILESVIEQAKAGDLQAAALILARGVPALKATLEPVILMTGQEYKAMNTAERAEAIMGAALSGTVPPDVAKQLLESLGACANIAEWADLAERIEALEATK